MRKKLYWNITALKLPTDITFLIFAIFDLAKKAGKKTWEAEEYFMDLSFSEILEGIRKMSVPEEQWRSIFSCELLQFQIEMQREYNNTSLYSKCGLGFLCSDDAHRGDLTASETGYLRWAESGTSVSMPSLKHAIEELFRSYPEDEFFLAELYTTYRRENKSLYDRNILATVFFSREDGPELVHQEFSQISNPLLAQENHFF